MKYEEQLIEEVKTWCIQDPERRAEKMQRERIRHPKLIKDLLLDKLDTSTMKILEVGGGPEPLSDLLDFEFRIVVDPCADEYAEFFPTPDHLNMEAEDMGDSTWHETFDLIICTNALDHVRDVPSVMSRIYRCLKPGGYFAVMCAENNAITNPHPCHKINLTAADLHRSCDKWAETCWELTYSKDGYRYGWAEYQGKCGQPAFAILFRKAVGYEQ
jgi:SAM-dependent methyltransferase